MGDVPVAVLDEYVRHRAPQLVAPAFLDDQRSSGVPVVVAEH
ncbi:hypothetical protein [Actinopolymorpha rutila]